MKIYNLQLSLLNNLYSSKENRLVFDGETPGTPAVPAQAEKPAAKPEVKPEDKEKAELEKLTPEQLKARITARLAPLKGKMQEIAQSNQGLYTQKLQNEIQELWSTLGGLETQLNAIATPADTDKSTLTSIYTATRDMESKVSDELIATDKNTVTLIKSIQEKRNQFTGNPIPQPVIAEFAKQTSTKRINMPNADLSEFNVIFESYFTSLQDSIFNAKPDEVKSTIETIQPAVAALTVESVVEKYLDMYGDQNGGKQVLDGLNEIIRMEVNSVNGKQEKSDYIVDLVGCVLNGDKVAASNMIARAKAEIAAADGTASPENSEAETTQKAVYQKAAEILKDPEITAEDIAAAIATYDPGKYENGSESPKYRKVIEKLKAASKELFDAGIRIDFLGGTDGMHHRLIKDKGWHENKAAALKKLLEIQDNGNLEGTAIDPAIDPAQRPLIEAYIKAANASKGYEFVRDSADKSLFLNGQGIFDKALALQRAEKAHQEIYDYPINAKTHVVLEIGDHADDVTQRKSGIRLSSMEEKEKTITNPDTITMTPDELGNLIGQIGDNWKKNPEHPGQGGKGKDTDPSECSEDGKTGRKYKGPESDDYDYYKKEDGVWKRIIEQNPQPAPEAPGPNPPEGDGAKSPEPAAPAPKDGKDSTENPKVGFPKYTLEGDTLKVPFPGETEPTAYKLNLPEGCSAEVNQDAKGYFLRIDHFPLVGALFFDDEKKTLLSASIGTNPDFWKKYDRKLEGNEIKVTPKDGADKDEKPADKEKAEAAMRLLAKRHGVGGIILFPNGTYDYNDLYNKLFNLDNALAKIQKDHPYELEKLRKVVIMLPDQKVFSLSAGIQDGWVTGKVGTLLSVDYDEDSKEIAGDILDALSKITTAPDMNAPIEKFDANKVEAAKKALLGEIKDLELDFNDIDAEGDRGETRSRERFVSAIMEKAKAANIMPGKGFIMRLGYKKGEGVNFGKQLTWKGNVDVEEDNQKELAKIDKALTEMKAQQSKKVEKPKIGAEK